MYTTKGGKSGFASRCYFFLNCFFLIILSNTVGNPLADWLRGNLSHYSSDTKECNRCFLAVSHLLQELRVYVCSEIRLSVTSRRDQNCDAYRVFLIIAQDQSPVNGGGRERFREIDTLHCRFPYFRMFYAILSPLYLASAHENEIGQQRQMNGTRRHHKLFKVSLVSLATKLLTAPPPAASGNELNQMSFCNFSRSIMNTKDLRHVLTTNGALS